MTEVLVCDHFLILQLNLCTGLFSSFPVSPLSQHVPRKPEFLLVCVWVTQLCPTLCHPMDYTVHGILQARILKWEPFPSPGDLPHPGIKPRSPTLWVDSFHKGGPFRREWYLEAKKHNLRVLSPSGILLLLNFSHGQLGNVCVCMCVCIKRDK